MILFVPRRLGCKRKDGGADIGYWHTLSSLCIANRIKGKEISFVCTKENIDKIPSKFGKVSTNSINYNSSIRESFEMLIRDMALLELMKPKAVLLNEDPVMLKACFLTNTPSILVLEEFSDLESISPIIGLANKIVIPHPKEFFDYMLKKTKIGDLYGGLINTIKNKGKFVGPIIPKQGSLYSKKFLKGEITFFAGGRDDQIPILKSILTILKDVKLNMLGKKVDLQNKNHKILGYKEDYIGWIKNSKIIITLAGYSIYEMLYLEKPQLMVPRRDGKNISFEKAILCEWFDKKRAGIYIKDLNNLPQEMENIKSKISNEKIIKFKESLNWDGAQKIAKILESY